MEPLEGNGWNGPLEGSFWKGPSGVDPWSGPPGVGLLEGTPFTGTQQWTPFMITTSRDSAKRTSRKEFLVVDQQDGTRNWLSHGGDPSSAALEGPFCIGPLQGPPQSDTQRKCTLAVTFRRGHLERNRWRGPLDETPEGIP
jgi:hypothetical protein